MAHVELSLSEPNVPRVRVPEQLALDTLTRWRQAVDGAREPCLVVDDLGLIVSVSESCCDLLSLPDSQKAEGCSLYAGVLRLVDFTSQSGALTDGELEKTPPLLAISSQKLARGLLRVQGDQGVVTLDAVATPLWDGSGDGRHVVGSLTFFSTI